MGIVLRIVKEDLLKIIFAFVLNLCSSLLAIGVIAFINQYLLIPHENYTSSLVYFLLFVIVFFLISIVAQISLAKLGHNFVFKMQKMIVKQILDTEFATIQKIGKAKLLASLSSDIRSVSFGFSRCPEILQGILFALCASIYLYYISPPIFILLFIWLVITFGVSYFVIKRVYRYFRKARESDDKLQENYHSSIEGHRELTLNRFRAEHYYNTEFLINATNKKNNSIGADVNHLLAMSWNSAMLLALIGVILYFALGKGWGDLQSATTIVVTVLFIRGPIAIAIGAIPTLLTAKVSLEKIAKLELQGYRDGFGSMGDNIADWKTIAFRDVTFSYENGNFALKPFNLEIHRGEIVFCVGKNGSGKSTLSLLLAGLLKPTSGNIYLDNQKIEENNIYSYRNKISAIFGDFFLFTQALGKDDVASNEAMDFWLNQLEMSHKVEVLEGKLSTTALSQGQRKRLAMFIALLENRELLILDEWAADQDPIFRKFFYRSLIPLLKQRGITIFAISHDDSYFDVADRIILVKNGEIRELFGEERQHCDDIVEKIK